MATIGTGVRRDVEVPDEPRARREQRSKRQAKDAEAKLALDLDSLTAEMVVADVIPNPPRTKLVRDAEAKGCTVIDGLGMLVNQGITGIEYWTGETVDGNVMRARLEELFED